MTGLVTPAAEKPAASPAPLSFPDGAIVSVSTIQKRKDFLATARARRWVAKGMLVQGRRRRPGEPTDAEAIRVGYTCSKKVGNAVARNRAKRRLRAAAAAVLPAMGRAGWDYVLIGKNGQTAERVFADLIVDLETALIKLHEPKRT